MLYCSMTLTQTIIVCAVVVGVVLVSVLLMAGYKLFFRMMSSYATANVVRSNRDAKEDNPPDLEADKEFKAAKRYFFTRDIQGPAIYLDKKDWRIAPELSAITYDYGKKKQRTTYSAYFSADDFSEQKNFDKKPVIATPISETKFNRFVIAIHGTAGSGINNYRTAYAFLKRGYNVLCPDLAGHGMDKSRYIGMGVVDSQNIAEWIGYILKNRPDAEIVLYGVSMGAVTALLSAAKPSIKDKIKAVIADSSYADGFEEGAVQIKKHTKMTKFPFLYLADMFAKLLAGYSIKQSAPIKVVTDITAPVLFLHGEADSFVDKERSERLYANVKSQSELYILDGVPHALGIKYAYKEYFDKIDAFLATAFNGQEGGQEKNV